MNWNKIISEGKYIYEFQSFWVIKSSQCNISFYETYNISEIDEIVCNIISLNNNRINETKLAAILGFNIIDDFSNPKIKRYKDQAEYEIFNSLLKPVKDWNLIRDEKIENSSEFILTYFGNKALENKQKYKFFNGQTNLFEHFKIQHNSDFFPFTKLFNISPYLNSIKFLKPNDKFDFEFIEENDLLAKLQFQFSEAGVVDKRLFSSEQTKNISTQNISVSFKLLDYNSEVLLLVFLQGVFSLELTLIINEEQNKEYKNQKIDEGLYKKLIEDPEAILSYENIIRFYDLLDFNSLLIDKRLLWNDTKLFDLITASAKASQWRIISENCPVDLIIKNLDIYCELFDWSILTKRLDNDIIKSNITKYPWDFEYISNNSDIELIKSILELPDYKTFNFDWIELTRRFDFNFITQNINKYDFDYYYITETYYSDLKSFLLDFPLLPWNWNFISKSIELEFVFNNLAKFGVFLNLETIIDRIFHEKDWIKHFINLDEFTTLLSKEKQNSLSNFSISSQDFLWSNTLIDYFHELGFISWSNRFSQGFESNKFVIWDFALFAKYHTEIKSENGFKNISEKITDKSVITEFPDFTWDWNTISNRKDFINDLIFIAEFSHKLNWNIALQAMEPIFIETNFYEICDFINLKENISYWSILTRLLSEDFIEQNIYDYAWDTNELLNKSSEFISSILLFSDIFSFDWDFSELYKKLSIDFWKENSDKLIKESNVHSKVADFWEQFTKEIDIEFIKENLEYPWSWNYITTSKFSKEDILENLMTFGVYWNWNYLLDKVFSKEELKDIDFLTKVAGCLSIIPKEKIDSCWKIITRKFSFSELKNLINETLALPNISYLFQWDWNYISGHQDFNIATELDNWKNNIDWVALSANNKLNKLWSNSLQFYSNRKLWENWIISNYLDKYPFDFKNLTKFSVINSNKSILEKFIQKWDWDYLTEKGSIFHCKTKATFIERLHNFKDYLSWTLLGKRSDTFLNIEIIKRFKTRAWDWSGISENNSIELSNQIIIELQDKPFNWNTLSKRKDIIIDNEFLKLFSDKDLDWSYISNNNRLDYTVEIINILQDKPLNWFSISKNDKFIPSIEILRILDNKELDWQSISKHRLFSPTIEALNLFGEKIDWLNILHNPNFDINDRSLLSSFKNKLDWNFISKSEKLKINSEWLDLFKVELNWNYICKRKDFQLSVNVVDKFKEYLDWNLLSENTALEFSKDLICNYKYYWNWSLLFQNPTIQEHFENDISQLLKTEPIIEFVSNIKVQPNEWAGYFYHFTHLSNAIKIIKEGKIKGRNFAELINNSAGNVYLTSTKPRNFARFYFRPQTPAQFYNQGLGKEPEDDFIEREKWKMGAFGWEHSFEKKHIGHYQTWRQMNFPKCLCPVFFVIDLNELYKIQKDKIFISNGNMQGSHTIFGEISEMIKKFDFENLFLKHESIFNLTSQYFGQKVDYEKWKNKFDELYSLYKNKSQQELLIYKELDLFKIALKNIKIVCPDYLSFNFLKNTIPSDNPLFNSIIYDENLEHSYYHGYNKSISITKENNSIEIQKSQNSTGYIKLILNKRPEQILIEGDIFKETNNSICFNKEIKIQNFNDIEIEYIDTETNQIWKIYKNTND